MPFCNKCFENAELTYVNGLRVCGACIHAAQAAKDAWKHQEEILGKELIVDTEDLQVFKMCLESYPCIHKVKDKDGDTFDMDGDDIYELLVQKGIQVPPHFEEYADSDPMDVCIF